MKKLFPNIETTIIMLGIICVILWGISRCSQKKTDIAVKNAAEMAEDSLAMAGQNSPAAVNRNTTPNTQQPIQTPQQPTPVPPSYNTNTPPPTNPSQVQPAPQQPVPQLPTNAPTNPSQVQTVPLPNQQQPQQAPKSVNNGTRLYVLIDKLNVRKTPELNAKSLGKLRLYDEVFFMNEVTEVSQAVRLANGETIDKPWFKIKTKKGTVGWVHGSGVDFYKRKTGREM